ncbi:amidohydrolase family protein [Litorimonas sp. RW-G-Af-16]|uniref:amidohydrolase family protein n=1 Tax=Litorimonas sp. RW-G-Af-16 TaxID=3241168 RepID=UPI003AAF46A2
MFKTLRLRKFLTISSSLIVALFAGLSFLYFTIQPPKLIIPEKTDLILSNLTIWNPGLDFVSGQTLEISDGIITNIEPSKSDVSGSICTGCYAMPGLIDAHIHTPPSIAIGNRELFSLLYLQNGVTAVRDLGQFDDDLPKLIRRIESGKLAGPRMYRCGRILDGDPPSVPGAILVESAEDGKRTVAKHASQGVDCIKVYGNLSPDAFQGVSEEANLIGLPLIGHTPNSISFGDIKNFESQHYTGIPYLIKPAPIGRAYKNQDLIDMTESDINDVLNVMVMNNISFLPTNANLMSRLTVSDIERFPPSEGFKHLPEFWEIAWPSIVSHPETEAEIQTELEARAYALSFIRKANESGIDVLVGTDVIMPYVIPGEAMHQQLEIMSQALGSNEKALQAATHVNGKHIDPGKIGQIATGAYADILLFKNNPRHDLATIKNWDYAIVDGRVYSRKDVDAAVEKFDKHFRGALYSRVMNAAYKVIAGEYEASEVSNH